MIPIAEADGGIGVGSFVRKLEDGFGTACYRIIPSPGSFIQIAYDRKLRTRVPDIQLIIPKLASEPVGLVRLDETVGALSKDQVAWPDG